MFDILNKENTINTKVVLQKIYREEILNEVRRLKIDGGWDKEAFDRLFNLLDKALVSDRDTITNIFSRWIKF